MRGAERHVDVARFLDRLAAVQRLQHCELARALLQDASDAEQVLRALRARKPRPAVLERIARRADGEVDLFACRLADLGERLLGRRRDRCIRLLRLQPLATDEVPVALAQRDDVARLGRRRIFPTGWSRRTAPLAL